MHKCLLVNKPLGLISKTGAAVVMPSLALAAVAVVPLSALELSICTGFATGFGGTVLTGFRDDDDILEACSTIAAASTTGATDRGSMGIDMVFCSFNDSSSWRNLLSSAVAICSFFSNNSASSSACQNKRNKVLKNQLWTQIQ